jgi:hypothetical protein
MMTTNKFVDPTKWPWNKIFKKEIMEEVAKPWNIIADAMSLDIALSATPATLGSSAAAVNAAIAGAEEKFTREVIVKLTNTEGDTHSWYTGTFAIAVAKSSTSGVVAIADEATTVDIINGIGTVVLEYTGTWAEADTTTLTVTGGTVQSVALGNKTSIDTLVA